MKRQLLRLACVLMMGSSALVLFSTRAAATLVDLTPTSPAVNSAGSVSLADLISGQAMGIQVGDKLFTGFSYSKIGDMPTAADVMVLGFKDPNGNWGVTFHGAFIDLPGGGGSDALIRFNVAVNPIFAQRGIRIVDAHLFLGGVGVGDNSVFTVDESFLQNDSTLNAYKSTLPPGGTKLSDVAQFAPVVSLNVTKDIFALAGEGSFLPARATAVDQSFSQTPEPATIVMLGMSASLAIVGVRRRTQS